MTDLPCQREIFPLKPPKLSEHLIPKLEIKKLNPPPKEKPRSTEVKELGIGKLRENPTGHVTIQCNTSKSIKHPNHLINNGLIKLIEDKIASEQKLKTNKKGEGSFNLSDEKVLVTGETMRRNGQTLSEVINEMNPSKTDRKFYKEMVLSCIMDDKKVVVDVSHPGANCQLCKDTRYVHFHEHRVVTRFGEKVMMVDPNRGRKLKCSTCRVSDHVGSYITCLKCSITMTCRFECHHLHIQRCHTQVQKPIIVANLIRPHSKKILSQQLQAPTVLQQFQSPRVLPQNRKPRGYVGPKIKLD